MLRTNAYRDALQEFQSATRVWEHSGEPRDGPIYERLETARERFIEVQREYN